MNKRDGIQQWTAFFVQHNLHGIFIVSDWIVAQGCREEYEAPTVTLLRLLYTRVFVIASFRYANH